MDEDQAATLMSWVPRKLAPNVRCVFSMIPDTPQHKALVNREPMPKIIQVNPLDIESRKVSYVVITNSCSNFVANFAAINKSTLYLPYFK